MKNLWAWTFSLLLFAGLGITLWKINPQDVFGEGETTQKIQVSTNGEKLLLVLIEGLNEAEFSSMLRKGELPHLGTLLEKNTRGIPKGIYLPLLGVISENERPNFAPILKGVHPDTKDLSTYPDIYSYLDDPDFYNPKMVGSKSVESFFVEADPINTDFTRVVKFLSYVTPELDYRLETYRSFNNGVAPLAGTNSGKLWQTYQIFKERMGSERQMNALPKFSFLKLKSPAQTGNQLGIGPEYRKNLKQVDQMLGALFDVLSKFNLDKNLNIMVTSSYSRTSKLISQNRSEIKLPFIVSGPSLNYQEISKFSEMNEPLPSVIIHRQSLNLLRLKQKKSQKKGRSIATADDSINFWY